MKLRKPALMSSVGVVAALAITACGSSETKGKGVSVAGTAAKGSAPYLADVCPATIAIQTDWNPESEHGELYQLLGGKVTIDDAKKLVTGALVDPDGKDTGVKLQIRAGGPAIGYDSVANKLYSDPSLYLGYVTTDDAMVAAAKQPVVAVAATKEKSPTAIMWDPKTNPTWKTIDDIKAAGAKVRYTNGLAYMDYLTHTGKLSPKQVDGSYDGTPGSFVADAGKSAQQGYATAEPYLYQHEIAAWGRPLAFQLVADTGYNVYVQALSMRADRVQKEAACLKKLVPMVQQAQIDFLKEPAPVNKLIVQLVKRYNTGWQYSPGVAAYSVAEQAQLGIVGNGPDQTLGNQDMERIQKLIDVEVPILRSKGINVPKDLKPESIATNEFIAPSIGLK